MTEFDSAGTVFKRPPKSLAALLRSSAEGTRLWRPEELGAIFRHQMSSPILVDLGGYDPGVAARLKRLSEAQNLVLRSFSDLFQHASPPLELLELTKNFAKANLDQPESGLPSEVAAVLYYASIAAALVRLDKRITQLPDAELRKGLLLVQGQLWLDAPTKELLLQATKRFPLPAEPERPRRESGTLIPHFGFHAAGLHLCRAVAELIAQKCWPLSRPGLLATLGQFESSVLGGGGMGLVLFWRETLPKPSQRRFEIGATRTGIRSARHSSFRPRGRASAKAQTSKHRPRAGSFGSAHRPVFCDALL